MCRRRYGALSGWANIPNVDRTLRSFPRFARDWRIRTVVPVVIVNVIAFAGLYALMYHFSISNLVQTRKLTADILFDEIIFDFGQGRGAATVLSRLDRHARAHQLVSVNVLKGGGVPVPAHWNLGKNNVVVFTRGIRNEALCQGCHGSAKTHLAVLELGFDLTAPIAAAKQRVRQRFVLAGAAWMAILGVLFWSARRVIGRPLAEIERTILGPDDRGQPKDLGQLARLVDRKLWELIDARRQREEDITRHMARAEQLAALGQVAAGLTHEIKNPLAGVIAAIEVLRSEGRGDDELLEQMLSELRRVTTTLDGLLRLAKPQPPQRTAVDMVRVLREVSALFTARARRMGIALDIDVPDIVPSLQLDQSLMVQVVVNLLTNALQATDRGGTVKVLLAAFPRRDGLVLAVSDTGKGIAPEELQHVFDPFFTTKEEGTGLGLPICRQIVEQHGGTIEIQSTVGEGTRVMVLLPAVETNEEAYGAVAAG